MSKPISISFEPPGPPEGVPPFETPAPPFEPPGPPAETPPFETPSHLVSANAPEGVPPFETPGPPFEPPGPPADTPPFDTPELQATAHIPDWFLLEGGLPRSRADLVIEACQSSEVQSGGQTRGYSAMFLLSVRFAQKRTGLGDL